MSLPQGRQTNNGTCPEGSVTPHDLKVVKLQITSEGGPFGACLRIYEKSPFKLLGHPLSGPKLRTPHKDLRGEPKEESKPKLKLRSERKISQD